MPSPFGPIVSRLWKGIGMDCPASSLIGASEFRLSGLRKVVAPSNRLYSRLRQLERLCPRYSRNRTDHRFVALAQRGEMAADNWVRDTLQPHFGRAASAVASGPDSLRGIGFEFGGFRGCVCSICGSCRVFDTSTKQKKLPDEQTGLRGGDH